MTDSPTYIKIFNSQRRASPFLNAHAEQNSLELHSWRTWSRTQLEGHAQHYALKLIPEAEGKIEAVEGDYQRWCRDQVNQGRAKPEGMPSGLAEEHDTLRARLDVLKEEAKAIGKVAAQKAKEQQKVDATKVLARGCRGQGKLRHGLLVALDGQSVGPGPDGLLVITDDRSPFNGMQTAHYFEHVAKPWRMQAATLVQERVDEAARRQVPIGTIPERKPPLPDWPENVPKPDSK